MTAEEIVAGSIAANAIQKEGEFTSLIEWLLDRPAPGAVLEIGTYHGGTLSAWCQIARPDATIVTIDAPSDSPAGATTFTDDDQDRLLALARPNQNLVLIRGDSHASATFSEAQRALPDGHADLLFIDGDHSFTGALADWHDYGPLVRQGGVVIFHDIISPPTEQVIEVDRVWAMIGGQKLTFLSDEPNRDFEGQWGGLGVVIR